MFSSVANIKTNKSERKLNNNLTQGFTDLCNATNIRMIKRRSINSKNG
jgi:hypothetical protein